jgi:hypothetical protein
MEEEVTRQQPRLRRVSTNRLSGTAGQASAQAGQEKQNHEAKERRKRKLIAGFPAYN